MAPDLTRYYRGSCPHGTFFALLRYPTARDNPVEIVCSEGCPVTLTSTEPSLDPSGRTPHP